MKHMTFSQSAVAAPDGREREWVAFQGGELEGQRSGVLCAACRARRRAADQLTPRADAPKPALCFACYRAGVEHDRRVSAAASLHTASDARFQSSLPFEPVDRRRLARLQAERTAARAVASVGAGVYGDRRRHAQIEARHALQRLADGLRARALAPADRARAMGDALHAAELQLPEAWLPFVAAR